MPIATDDVSQKIYLLASHVSYDYKLHARRLPVLEPINMGYC